MPVEVPLYINTLNSANPVHATDPVSEGDDHIRYLKAAIQSTFSAITGEVTADHTELNLLDGATGKTGTGFVVLSASPTLTGTVNVTGALTATGAISGALTANDITVGQLPDARIQATGVTQHQASLTITESQISDLGAYIEDNGTFTTLDIGGIDTELSRAGEGRLEVNGRPVYVNDDDTMISGKIFFSNGVEPTTEGTNGDIFLVY